MPSQFLHSGFAANLRRVRSISRKLVLFFIIPVNEALAVISGTLQVSASFEMRQIVSEGSSVLIEASAFREHPLHFVL